MYAIRSYYEINELFIPLGATKFISKSGLKGNMFNPGHFGGCLAYFLYPERKIFLYNHHIVITSYSIHYTKLYESDRVLSAAIIFFASASTSSPVTFFMEATSLRKSAVMRARCRFSFTASR